MPEVGFEPTKHFAAHLECAPFDHSGTPATDPPPSSSNIILPHQKKPNYGVENWPRLTTNQQ